MEHLPPAWNSGLDGDHQRDDVTAILAFAAPEGRVKVYLLAGRSKMEAKGRVSLAAPGLPVVVGQNGQNGFKSAEGGMKKVKDAQASMEQVPDFRDNVKVVATDVLWDPDADKLIATWRQYKEAWDKAGSDYGYPYLGSVRTFCRIGRAFGEAMLHLLKGP